MLFYIAERADLEWRADEVLQWVKEDSLKLRTERVLPLAEASAAHVAIESRKRRGSSC